tara:strand:- start:541 stop:954 length:414 start_codon:yes stop_codon:yes gene_type:complete
MDNISDAPMTEILTLYEHHRLVSPAEWRGKFFKPHELACKGTGELMVEPKLIEALDDLRARVGKPITISSCYRSAYHNARVGGAPKSAHRRGIAADIPLAGHDKSKLIELAKQAGFTGFGINYRTFLHVDLGRARSW